jgi:hypothetical protein
VSTQQTRENSSCPAKAGYLPAAIAYLASVGAIAIVVAGLWHSHQINVYRQTHDMSEVYQSIGPDFDGAIGYLLTMALGGVLVLTALTACCLHGMGGWVHVTAWLTWLISVLALAFFAVHHSLGLL